MIVNYTKNHINYTVNIFLNQILLVKNNVNNTLEKEYTHDYFKGISLSSFEKSQRYCNTSKTFIMLFDSIMMMSKMKRSGQKGGK